MAALAADLGVRRTHSGTLVTEELRFEARHLKPYAETVAAKDLVEGTVYFAVHFLDADALIPVMDPLVFIGRDLRTGDAGRLYLQDYASYVRGVRFPDTGTDGLRARYETTLEDRMISLHGFESGLNELLACSLRRTAAAIR
jgi:hypothetical protein